MSFAGKWTKSARKAYDGLKEDADACRVAREARNETKSTKQEGLFKQVKQSVARLLEDPKHPGLNTHEYRSLAHPYKRDGKVFEAYAQNRTPGAYRVFWCYGPTKGDITILAITPHP